MSALIPELEVVALTEDLPAYGLKAGDIGAGVIAHDDEYTVEFVRQDGHTIALVQVEPHQIRRIDRAHEILTSHRIEA
jgi:hypothetical protein